MFFLMYKLRIEFEFCVTKPNLGVAHSKANLLTLGCNERKYSIHLQGTKQRVRVAYAQKT